MDECDKWTNTVSHEQPAKVTPASKPLSGIERLTHLGYLPFLKQQEFHNCAAKYRLFGGAAGPGKSKALLMEAIRQALDYDGVNTLLLRRTFPELENSLLLYFRRDIPRFAYRSYNEARRIITWHNGSTTRFGYSQSENDIYQYQSSEYLFIGVDELTHFTLRQWQFLTSRNRCPVPGTTPRMAGATNPGNIGHAWVKALFIDKQPAAGMDPREYDANDYAFIPARFLDNPIYANDAAYLKTLEQLPDYFRRAFLEGDWSVFAGQYFTNFDPTRNVVRAEMIAAAGDAVRWRPRWISIDWGFEHPAAVYWHMSLSSQPGAPSPSASVGAALRRPLFPARSTAGGINPPLQTVASADAPHPVTATYREFIAQHFAPRTLAAEIIERSRMFDGKPERIEAIYLSPDAFARRTDESSIAEQMGDVLASAGLPRPVPADNDRIGGWMLMYQMLDAGEWLIADSCPELIRTLPELVRDEVNVEDIAKRDGDDAADAARYGLKSRFSMRVASPTREQIVAERVNSSDPTIRAIQAHKAQLELRSGDGPILPRWSRRRGQ